MTITTKTRQQLKSYFVKNAIPTEGNFADLIDAPLNQTEDGVFKVPGEPLSVVAAAGVQKRVLRFYSSFPAQNPDWLVSLNPLDDPSKTNTARAGLGVTDAAGNPRLVIDAATGFVGLGTNNPQGGLDVRLKGTADSWDRFVVTATNAFDGANNYVTIGAGGAGGIMLRNPHVPWIAGEGRASIRFGRSGGAPQGAYWDVGTRAGNAFTVALNGAADHKLWLLDNGSVGVGVSPTATLDVAGNALIRGALTVNNTLNLARSLVVAPAQVSTFGGRVDAAAGLTVSGGAVTIGTPQANQSATVHGTLATSGLITASGGLLVASGASAFNNHVDINGGLTIASGTLQVNQNLVVSGPLAANNGLTVFGSLQATCPVQLSGALTFVGGPLTVGTQQAQVASTFSGPVTVHGILSASSPLQANNTLTVAGNLIANNVVQANAGLAVNGGQVTVGSLQTPVTTIISGATTVNSTLAVSGALSANGGVNVTGNVNATGNLGASTLSVNSSASIPGLLDLSGPGRQMINLSSASFGVGVQNFTLYLRTPRNLAVYQGGTHDNNELAPGAGGTAALVIANGNVGVGTNAPGNNRVRVVGAARFDGTVAVDNLLSAEGGVVLAPTTMNWGGRLSTGKAGVRLYKSASQHIVLPTIPQANNFAGGLTAQAWIYINSFGDYARILDLGNGIASNNILFFTGGDGSLGAAVLQGNSAGDFGNVRTPAGVVPLRAWTHVAITVDAGVGTSTGRFFVNGQLVTSSTMNVPVNVDRTVNYIGRSNWGNDPYFDGTIAELSLWQGARPIYLAPLSGNEAGLVGYWKFDRDATDARTGGTLHGTGVNGPTFGLTVESDDWRAPTLIAPWIEYAQGFNPSGFFKDASGIVHLRGLVRTAGAPVQITNSPCFTLPCGFRPQYNELFCGQNAGGAGRIDVNPSGVVQVTIGHTLWTSLDGITFRAFR